MREPNENLGRCAQLSLLHLQINALILLVQAQQPTQPIREQFRRFVNDGVQLAGLETMQGFRNRIQEGVVQQDMRDLGFDDLWGSDEGPDSPQQAN